uniref:Putative secreted protein n=1 Tax=Anopheles triannulatus TaxID=58253 RepID=A0A2M4B4K6_9DIPT
MLGVFSLSLVCSGSLWHRATHGTDATSGLVYAPSNPLSRPRSKNLVYLGRERTGARVAAGCSEIGWLAGWPGVRQLQLLSCAFCCEQSKP